MNTQRHILLWTLVGFLILIVGVVVWSDFYTRQTHFLAGTRPATAKPSSTIKTTLPPIRATDPTRGSQVPEALLVVEFADFACPYCRLLEPELNKALAESSRPIKFVWRDFPIPSAKPDGIVAALAARCARDQGKFWQMHDELFKAQTFDLSSIKLIAQNLSLDPIAFNQCLTGGPHFAELEQDIVITQQHGVSGAPTLFIGSEVVSGYVNADEIMAMIRRAPKYKP
ncbi:MAG: thioredoxin domain-containing protein [Candidatus Uhrbacteria bacterium]|nr:thioredoxin domain-containing protein [Candidatus Uhrbacteria bacterium]